MEEKTTFAGDSENKNSLENKEQHIKEARAKFDAYSTSEYDKSYFDEDSGGYIVTNRKRIEHAQTSKNETEKFQKEYEQALVFAKNGHEIEFLKGGSSVNLPDIKFDGVFADLKRTSSHNNITNYAKKAIREQNAKIVLFQFDNETEKIYLELFKLKNKYGIEAHYFFTGKNKVYNNL